MYLLFPFWKLLRFPWKTLLLPPPPPTHTHPVNPCHLKFDVSLNIYLLNLWLKMSTEIRCHQSYSIDEKSLMNSNPFNGLCCRLETTWISFFPTQNQIARTSKWIWIEKSSAAHLHYFIHNWRWAKVPARPIVILASYLVVFSNFHFKKSMLWWCHMTLCMRGFHDQ